ncbi:MAG: efflux RND transporter periplasmic adaptor subunit [Myxococcales bacterium]
MTITRRTLVLSGVCAGVLAAVIAAVGAQAKSPAGPVASAAADPAVQTVEPKQVQSLNREEITGTLQPARQLQLGFEVSGRLAKLNATKGAQVREGQVIAQLDPEMADAQVLQAEAAVKAAEAQSAQAADTARRQSELQQKGSISDWQSKSSTSQAAAAAAQLQAARAQLAQARATRRRHDLAAPFAGTLVEEPDQVGATVSPGKELFTLEQLDPLVLKLTVRESSRGSLRVGAKVRVEAVGGGARTDEAVVRAIIPSADAATRRIPVEIVVPNAGARFTAHTLARASLPLGQPEPALELPASALASTGGDHVYAVAGSGEVKRIPVQVVDRGAQKVVVKSSEPLSRIVDYPAADLAEGAKVSVR